MIEITWAFGYDAIAKKVTNPDPWIDANDLGRLAQLVSDRLIYMRDRVAILQKRGWILQLSYNGLSIRHNELEWNEDARKCIEESGIPFSEYNVINNNPHYNSYGD